MPATALPQLDRLFLTDAGLETDMIYNRGLDLPYFASITLLQSDSGRTALENYFRDFIALARRTGTGCLLESATWRASADWASALDVSEVELDRLNQAAVAMLRRLRDEAGAEVSVIVSGCIGPRGDGYDPGVVMNADEAAAYHARQAKALAAGGPDMLSAITMTNVPEAIGVARAAQQVGLPVAISFTVETDGRLPAGDTLRDAIAAVDQATAAYPAYFMVNCAHPDHFRDVLDPAAPWTRRIGGVRANASRCSHAELDAMTELDIGDPVELGSLYRDLRAAHPTLNVLGGCCGTDVRHVAAIAEACAEAAV